MTFDGKLVSRPWYVVLTAARRAGVSFRLNSGRRTMAHQGRLRAAYLRYVKYGRPWAPLAAVPSCSAPHIRCDRPDHANDVNSLDGGAARLAAWLRRHGARAAFTVPGEPWHIEVPLADLKKLAARFRLPPLSKLTKTERAWVRELDRLRKAGKNMKRREELFALLKRRRKAIWRNAQKHGWKGHHRRARYEILHDRTVRYRRGH